MPASASPSFNGQWHLTHAGGMRNSATTSLFINALGSPAEVSAAACSRREAGTLKEAGATTSKGKDFTFPTIAAAVSPTRSPTGLPRRSSSNAELRSKIGGTARVLRSSGPNLVFEIQGRSIAGGSSPKAKGFGLGGGAAAASLGNSADTGSSPISGVQALAIAAGFSKRSLTTGEGASGNSEPCFELRVHSIAGENLATFSDARATWTGAEIAQRLLKLLAPGPPGLVYQLIGKDNKVLPRTGTLGPGPTELVAVSKVNEAVAELVVAQGYSKKIDPEGMKELRALAQPPNLVQVVTDAVLAVLGEGTGWKSWQEVSRDPGFIKRLSEFDADSGTDEVLAALAASMGREDFTFEATQRVSSCASYLCAWCRSVHAYCEGARACGL